MLQIPGYEAPVRGRTWWNISEIPLRDAAGNVEAVLILTEEVTDRKQAAETLRQSRATVSFVRGGDDAGCVDDKSAWRSRHDDPGMAGLHRPKRRRGTRLRLDERHSREDRSRVADAWRRAFETGGMYEVEYLLRIHDGSWRNILARGVPVRASDGQIREYMGVCIDITARKQVEAALRESEQRFRTMADAIPQLAWIAKADGWIFWYNRRWYEYTGTTPEQMEGWGWQSVHDPQTLSTVLERWKVSIATGKPFDMTFPLRGVDGVFRPFLTRIMPLRDEQGRVVQWFGTNTDISEQKATEKELATAKARAERAKAAAEQANRAKDHFLAVLSHELRTPLTPVVMGVSMLQDRPDLDPAVRETLEMVRRNVEMEARLIDDLLDVSRIARGKIELQQTARGAVYGHPAGGRGLQARHRGPQAALRRGPGTGRALLGRSRRVPAPAGLLEPAEERDQVHAARRLRGHPLPAGRGARGRRSERQRDRDRAGGAVADFQRLRAGGALHHAAVRRSGPGVGDQQGAGGDARRPDRSPQRGPRQGGDVPRPAAADRARRPAAKRRARRAARSDVPSAPCTSCWSKTTASRRS